QPAVERRDEALMSPTQPVSRADNPRVWLKSLRTAQGQAIDDLAAADDLIQGGNFNEGSAKATEIRTHILSIENSLQLLWERAIEKDPRVAEEALRAIDNNGYLRTEVETISWFAAEKQQEAARDAATKVVETTPAAGVGKKAAKPNGDEVKERLVERIK